MIVTVDVKCIFHNGNPQEQLKNYARPFLSAFKDVGYEVVIVTDTINNEALEKRLQMEMIPFSSIDRFPYSAEDCITYDGLITIKSVEGFNWLEVKDGMKYIFHSFSDYYSHFHEAYTRRVVNEPYFTPQQMVKEVNELSQA